GLSKGSDHKEGKGNLGHVPEKLRWILSLLFCTKNPHFTELACCCFLHHLRQHANETRMIVHRTGADQVQSMPYGNLSRFNIEIVQHFEVITDKTQRHNHHFTCALSGKLR